MVRLNEKKLIKPEEGKNEEIKGKRKQRKWQTGRPNMLKLIWSHL